MTGKKLNPWVGGIIFFTPVVITGIFYPFMIPLIIIGVAVFLITIKVSGKFPGYMNSGDKK